MSDDLKRHRWKKAKSASDLPPIDALYRLIDEIENGETNIEHIIVIFGIPKKDDERFDGMGFFQSGPYPGTHAIGLLEYCKAVLLQRILDEG